MENHKYLHTVVDEDVRFILEREKIYKGSWKKSGGRSAWFMLVRKMDRLQEMVKGTIPSEMELKVNQSFPTNYVKELMSSEDIFKKIELNNSGEDGTVLAEIRDLRRYLILVESEMIARGVVGWIEPKVDNKHEINWNGRPRYEFEVDKT